MDFFIEMLSFRSASQNLIAEPRELQLVLCALYALGR